MNSRSPGGQRVATANGQLEPIAEIGDAFPLTGLKKVNSFSRSLISVALLTKLVGLIAFDADHVYAVSAVGAKIGVTPIGDVTPNRLYSFDLPRLQEHCRKFAHLLPKNSES